ncbi:hypothetical protein JL37_02565 [Achromobacter sp. RTa]|uniref:acetyl-CoA carboxylase biotin carboxyl carrier protein n=1 Tax=Achromobacter sp. RTa TaxID=1532557 RepID=UPI00051024F0|nr:biotin/lipoyl-containing protein [Achromobacter sp. RTa]KGE00409.1 hypothetical protein JL37_02565 [Achromobacter sp. RTa]
MTTLSDIRTYVRQLRLRGIESVEIQEGERLVSIRIDVPAISEDAATPEAAPTPDSSLIDVRSATLGRLLRSHADRLPVQIETGDEVSQGQLLALVALDENLVSVHAPVDGSIGAVLGAEGQIVGYGMPLFQLKPRQR